MIILYLPPLIQLCIFSTFLCISIRKPSVLQQRNERTTFNHVKGASLEKKDEKTHRDKVWARSTGNELVPAPLCSCTVLPFDARTLFFLSCFFFPQFSRTNGFTKGPQDCPRQKKTGTAETPDSTKVQGTATPLRAASPKTSSAQPQNPTLTGCIL